MLYTKENFKPHTYTYTLTAPHTCMTIALSETRTHTHIHVRIFSTHFGRKRQKMREKKKKMKHEIPIAMRFPNFPRFFFFFWPQKLSYQKRTNITVSFLNFFCFFSSWNIVVLGVFSRSQKNFFTIRWCWYWYCCCCCCCLAERVEKKKKRTNERKTKRGKFRRTDPLESLPSNRILLLDGHTCTFPFRTRVQRKKRVEIYVFY